MNKFDEIFNISSLILEKYNELSKLTKKNGNKDSLIREIRNLVLQEYKLIHQLTKDEANDIVSKIDCIRFGDCAVVAQRINIKLKNLLDEYEGNVIKCSEFGISYLPVYMNVSTFDAISSMIDIDMIKSLKIKLDSLNITNEKDRKFVNMLYSYLENSKNELLHFYSLSEIISLSYNDNIDILPRIDLTKIKDKLTRWLRINDGVTNSKAISMAIAVYGKYVIDEFAENDLPKNNPRDMFEYVSYVTKLEVLISYMDREELVQLEEYCNRKKNDKNKLIVNNVKQLIRNKNKN